MACFKGLARKLVVPMLAVFSLGWLLCFVGFMMSVHRKERDTFWYIPDILASIGPVVVVVEFLHAALPGRISAFLGSISSFVGVFCYMGFGYLVCGSSTDVYYKYVLVSNKNQVTLYREVWLTLVGSYLASFAWMYVLIARNCFSYDRVNRGVETIVDDQGHLTDANQSSAIGPRRNIIFAGMARKLAVVVLFLLGASWCLYVAGVIEETRNTNLPANTSVSVPLDFPTWASCVVGLFAIFSAVGHAGAYGGASTAMGVFTAILGMFFIACSSSIGFWIAILLHWSCGHQWNCSIWHSTVPRYMIYQISGTLSMCVFWACLAALWPFYFKETDVVQNSRRNTRVHQQFMRQQVQEYDERVPLLQGQEDDHRNKSHFSVF